MDSSKKPNKPNPREYVNIFSQIFFLWSIPLLYKGSKFGLNTDDLTKCLKKDCSKDLGDELEKEWKKEYDRAKTKGRKPRLKIAMLKTYWLSCITDGFISFIQVTIKSIVPLVLAQLLLKFQDPAINFIEVNDSNITSIANSSSSLKSNKNVFNLIMIKNLSRNMLIENESINADEDNLLIKIWNDVHCLSGILVLATLIACFLYHHVDLRQRLLGARMRIACSSLIYRKTLRISRKTAGQTPAGYLINLLSNDVARFDYGFIFVHYIWILPFQSILICYLIWQKIGIAALIAVGILLLQTVPLQTSLSKITSKLRIKIARKTDKRVGIMNEIIQGIQVIKMYAWEKSFQSLVAEVRRLEIKQIRFASYLRGFYVSSVIFTERNTLFITIVSIVLLNQTATADIVFSIAQYLNILQLIASIYYPLSISFGAEALVSIKRIEKYLLKDEHQGNPSYITNTIISDQNNLEAVLLKNVSAKWDDKYEDTLSNLNLKFKKRSLCAVIGPVGSGKSSLLQLLLKELPLSFGDIQIEGKISFVPQEPWLFGGTIRSNILFGEKLDKKRYNEITKCCALLTDFEQLPYGDKTVIGERGASLSGGQRARISLARAVYKKAQIYLLDDPLSAVDTHVGRHLFDEVIGPNGCLNKENATRIIVTHHVHFLKDADWIFILENGKLTKQGKYNDLANSNLDFGKLLEQHHEKAEQNANGGEIYEDEDEIPYIDGVSSYLPLKKRYSNTSSLAASAQSLPTNDENVENQVDGNVSIKIWKKYFFAGGSSVKLTLFLMLLLISQIIVSGADYFVNIFTQQEYLRISGRQASISTKQCLVIYGILTLGVIFVTLLRSSIFFKFCMHASKVLHNQMFENILLTTMRFFDINSSGQILNRFSKDMGIIDEYLPRSFMDCIQISLVMSGILILVSIVNPVLLAPLFITLVIYYLIFRLYLRPSLDFKRLEGICKSPVFSHLSSTLTGLSTIRSRSLQKLVKDEFDNLQDIHSSLWQLTMSVNTALGLWVDCISCTFLAVVSFSFIISDQTLSGSIGLAISQTIVLAGMVQFGIRQVTESIQFMTSVERVLQYTDLDRESEIKKLPPKNWPTEGKIEFRKINLRYDPNLPLVLKNLQITIEPSWKVGIVGRTGAGKSSLINALFRLSPIEGDIIIDGIETGSISLPELRSSISIIPQDPVLFSATIRYNLDPFGKYSDNEIWKVLEEVELKSAINGLEFTVTERGSNFSVGQRQLVCLARAMLRNNKILVLDEATANVDPKTDALIQNTIRSKFKHCTVLTIAHRLHTVMDWDRILVMDAGSAKEFDIPYILLNNPDGLLRNMVEATGPHDAEMLKQIAEDTYRAMGTS